MKGPPDRTCDGRYIIVRGRLWRTSNPALSEERHESLVKRLMDARRAVAAAKRANDPDAEKLARSQVHQAKVDLGERGPVWWSDGAPDYNRHLLKNTPYADAAEGAAPVGGASDP